MLFLICGIAAILLGLFLFFAVNESNVTKYIKSKKEESVETSLKKAKQIGIIFVIIGIAAIVIGYF